MLKTGTVPVSDEIHRLPAAANGESEWRYCQFASSFANKSQSKAKPLYMLRRKTKRKNCGSSRLRWPCDDDTQMVTALL
jgi:hypothetical protein